MRCSILATCVAGLACTILACARLPAEEIPIVRPRRFSDVTRELDRLKKENKALEERMGRLEATLSGGATLPGKAATGAPSMTDPAAVRARAAEEKPTGVGRFNLGGGLTLKLEGDIRLRNEHIENGFDLSGEQNDDWNSTRLRTRIGLDIDYKQLLGGYMRFTNEFRWGSDTKYNTNPQAEDVRVDNAVVRVVKPGGLPFTFAGGRQDLLAAPERGPEGMYGEGWILFDGTPQDGSTTICFDALKLRFDGIPNTTIDAILGQPSRLSFGTGTTLANRYARSEFDEFFAALYGIHKFDAGTVAPLQLDLYAFYKDKNVEVNYNPAPTPFSPDPFWDPRLWTTALGGRFSTSEPILSKHLSFACEGAWQTGSIEPAAMTLPDTTTAWYVGKDRFPDDSNLRRDAVAGYAWAKLHLDQEIKELNPWVTVRFDYLSGDDPETESVYEGWDSFYSEWPKYSELLIYTWYDPFAPAHGDSDPNLGVWTNLYFPTLELGSRPDFGFFDKQVSVSARWRYLQSVEDNGPGGGNEVGQLATFYLEWRPLPYFRAHYYFDYFFVGDYYSASAEDAWFSRIEIMFLFN